MREIMYIGTYDDKILISGFENGKLEIINEVNGIQNPSYLHINKDVLYSVSETEQGGLQVFKIQNNELDLINFEILNQRLPCHLITDLNRNYLLVSNYGSGSVLMYNLNRDGSIDKSVNKIQYDNAHMHYSEFVGENIYTTDLGNDVIYIFDNNLKLLSKIYTGKGSGPRHLIVMEKLKRIIVVTEISNEILIYEKQNNEFRLIQKLLTLDKQTSQSYAGAIKISKNGKNIYVTNRGENTISVFKENHKKYELIQNISCFGDFPRDITLNKTEEYVVVANQKSNNVIVFKRDKESGMLTKIDGEELIVEKPSCIIIKD